MNASGTFEVSLDPQRSEDGVGWLSIDKTFEGDLAGTSKGQMLAVNTESGSAAYVALEIVDGALDGRSGTFILQHAGVMHEGEGSLTVTVVPGSGTGELAGLAGSMSIEVVDGAHRYGFEYTLPGA